MRRLLGLGLMLVLAGAETRPASGQVGFAAGWNVYSFSRIGVGEEEIRYEQAEGYHFGLFYDVGTGPVVVRPGLYFHNLDDVAFDVSRVAPGSMAPTFGLSLIELPVDVRVRLEAARIRVYGMAGPVLRFATTDSDAIRERLARWSLALSAGAGFELTLPGIGVKLYPEVRYVLGLTRFMDEIELLNADLQPVRTHAQRLNAFMLRLGTSL